MKIAAIYARVSSDQQKEEKTIASQTAALIEFARQENYQVPDEWVFEDEGYSGAHLIRPGLERIRDLAAGRSNPSGFSIVTGPVEPEICLSGLADGGISPAWR